MSGNSVASYACEMEMRLIVEMCVCVSRQVMANV